MNSNANEQKCSWERILDQMESNWPSRRWRDVGVVIGCSGGADSVTLVRALNDLLRRQTNGQSPARGFLVVAHFNHQLRGEQSDNDAKFTADLAKELKLTFELAEANTYRRDTTDRDKAENQLRGDSNRLDSDEASLRKQRMHFLIGIAKSHGARYISLAHSADDNVETVLHHLMRGTGPAGIAGIGHPVPIDEDLVLTRPLLQTRRQSIHQALTGQGFEWREDQSNEDCRYRRNWIRNQLIPTMELEFPHAIEAMQRAIHLQTNWRQCIDQIASDWLTQNLQHSPQITVKQDRETNAQILIAAVQKLWADCQWPRQAMKQRHWEVIAAMIQGQKKEPITLPSGIRVTTNSGEVVIECLS